MRRWVRTIPHVRSGTCWSGWTLVDFMRLSSRLWEALTDPQSLAGCIPGCDGFTDLGDDAYDIQIKAKVGPIVGAYTGRLSVSEKSPPGAVRSETYKS